MQCTHFAWISSTNVHLYLSPLYTSIHSAVHVIQAAQYYTQTRTNIVHLDYIYSHLWCGARTVLWSVFLTYIILVFPFYIFTLSSASLAFDNIYNCVILLKSFPTIPNMIYLQIFEPQQLSGWPEKRCNSTWRNVPRLCAKLCDSPHAGIWLVNIT